MIRYFYELNFYYNDDNAEIHSFFIGYFSTLKIATNAIKMLKNQPGFNEKNGKFEVNKFGVHFNEQLSCKSGIILYELSHEYTDDDGYDNYIVFGVYGSYEEAKEGLDNKKHISPFQEYPDGFCIAECKVDVCGWTEGFTPY